MLVSLCLTVRCEGGGHGTGDQGHLTNIMGMEEYMGDMELTVCAVCTIQADVKIAGISVDIIKDNVIMKTEEVMVTPILMK